MKTQRSIVFALLGMVLFLNSGAQEPQQSAFSLQEAIEFAVRNSVVHKNAALDQQNAEYQRKEIAAAGLPQINGSIDVKDFLIIPTTLLPADFTGGPPGTFIPIQFGTQYQSTAGLSASQVIFSNDYIFALKASREFLNLSRINTNRSKAELTEQVSKSYYLVLINRDQMKVVDANIVRWKRIYEETKAANEQGLREQIDVERLEVLYNNILSQKLNLEKGLSLYEMALKFQMGYDYNQPITLKDSLSVIESQFEELNISNIDISLRPEHQFIVSQQRLYDLDVKRLKWGYLPTLAAYGSYQWTSNRNDPDFLRNENGVPTRMWFKTALIGAQVNLNIFDGLARHNRIQQAKVTALKSQNTLKNLENGSRFEATVAATNYSNAFTNLKMQKRNISLAAHVVEVAQKKYDAGVGSNLEVVDAESSFKEAQTNYYAAVYNMIVAKIDYQKAIGTLTK